MKKRIWSTTCSSARPQAILLKCTSASLPSAAQVLTTTLHGSSVGMKIWLIQGGFWHFRSQHETTTTPTILFTGTTSDVPTGSFSLSMVCLLIGRSSQCHQAAVNQELLHIALIYSNRVAACIRWCSLFLSTHPGLHMRHYAPKLCQDYNHLQKVSLRDIIIWLEARQGFLHLSGSCHKDGRGKLS